MYAPASRSLLIYENCRRHEEMVVPPARLDGSLWTSTCTANSKASQRLPYESFLRVSQGHT